MQDYGLKYQKVAPLSHHTCAPTNGAAPSNHVLSRMKRVESKTWHRGKGEFQRDVRPILRRKEARCSGELKQRLLEVPAAFAGRRARIGKLRSAASDESSGTFGCRLIREKYWRKAPECGMLEYYLAAIGWHFGCRLKREKAYPATATPCHGHAPVP